MSPDRGQNCPLTFATEFTFRAAAYAGLNPEMKLSKRARLELTVTSRSEKSPPMSEKATFPAKNRLAGLIPTKGEAPRPIEQPQRATPSAASAASAQSIGEVKSLTLRLPGDEYDRLRKFAFDNRTTHQDVLAAALRDYLDAKT